MSINFQPSPKIQSLLDQDQWTDLSPDWATQGVANGGSTSVEARRVITNSNSSVNATAFRRTGDGCCWSIGQTHNRIDWTKKIVLQFIVRGVGTTNGASRISFGKTIGDEIGDLARKGIGIRIDGTAIKGQAHNGSALATVDLSTGLTNNIVFRITITSDGAGNVEWFVDKVSKGSSTAGPSVLGEAGESVLQSEVDNGADAATQFLLIADAKIYVEQ